MLFVSGLSVTRWCFKSQPFLQMYVWQFSYCVVEAFPTGERLSPSWLKYTFLVFRSHWFACSETFLSVGQFGFGVVGDAGFFVLLYVDRLHLLVPVLGTDLCGGSPWCLYLTTWFACLTPVWNKWPGCGRVGEEVKLGSRYSQLLTNT